MAERFAAGGRLLGLGSSPQARSDARHVAVEFVHPVIVGKRALPALGLTAEGGPLAAQLELAAEPQDIVMAFEAGEAAAVAAARQRGCLTVSFAPTGAEWELVPGGESVLDPFVRQEMAETAYHLLWELVHVFFEHRGLLEGREARPVHDTGASSFLYPFLGESETDLDSVLADVRQSVEMKADGDRPAAHADTRRGTRRAGARRARAEGPPRCRRPDARPGQRRFGHGCDGRGGRHALPAGCAPGPARA